MNIKTINFIKNFSYTLATNLISLFISLLIVLIVPKLIGVEDYGFWQLYLFYASYVAFLHFGWTDGLYLRYGGKKYRDLDNRLLFSQFYMLVVMQLIIALLIIIISFMYIKEENRMFIMGMTVICMIITNARSFPLFILQATNRIKSYARIVLIGQLIYCFMMILFLLVGYRDFKMLILADILGRVISLFYSMYCCKDIVFQKISNFYFSTKEVKKNINVGIKLMFAYIASLLIIGVVRFGIERSWDVSTFGKVSLTLSISKFIMIFINALGIVLFPVLRRTNENKLPAIYTTFRDALMVILFGLLLGYYPIKSLLTAWLPHYSDSLIYFTILFPMIIFEGKTALLINTYLKTMRKERFMLIVNLITLVFSIISTILTVVLLRNLTLTILSIVILLAFRSILAEIFLSRRLNITIAKDVCLELFMASAFILTAWFIDSWYVIGVYLLIYFIYLILKYKDLTSSLVRFKKITLSSKE